MNKIKWNAIAFSIAFVSMGLTAQDYDQEFISQKVIKFRDNPIVFDGKVNADEWPDSETVPLVGHWPDYSETPSTKTLIYSGYDEKYIYLAAICYDDVKGIQGPTFERDKWEMNMDQVCIILDSYNDNENALVFCVTPTGSRIDAAMSNDAQGGNSVDPSWNSFWEAKTTIFDTGWMVEAKIPFSSLRFQPLDNKVTMGLITYRYISRNAQMDIFPKVKPNWGFWSFTKPSQAQDVIFNKSEDRRPWFTSPYLLANTGYHYETADGSEAPAKINDNKITAGIDIQHAISENMNLDLSLNTDFAQVEADDQVVNLSRFSLFFPEKRRFFLERSSILDFSFENENRLFYSRRIGINNGEIVPLWGGARLIGRVKDYDLGMLTMQSRASDSFSPENFSVLRLRKKVSKSNSYVGAILTNRVDLDGNLQVTTGADAIINLFSDDYLKVNLASSYDSQDNNASNNFLSDRKRMYLLWENRSNVGFNYGISYSQADKNYRPAIGFEQRGDFKSFGDRIGYGWFTEKHKSLRYIRADLEAKLFLTSSTNKLESYLISPSFTIEWNRSNSLDFEFNNFFDRVADPFNLSSDIVIAKGEYVNRDATLSYQTPSVDFLNANFSATYGAFYGGDRFSLGITPNYVISKYISLSGFYQYNRIDFGSQIYNAHVGRLKVSTSLNVKLSINAFVQMNTLTKTNAINVRLRYNSKDGNDLYVVYNESLNESGRKDVLVPFSDYRGITVKYIHTFHL